MSTQEKSIRAAAMQPTRWQLGLLALALIALVWLYRGGLASVIERWETPEYNHGYAIPFIALYLLWINAARYREQPHNESWLGFVTVLFGLLLLGAGEMSAIPVIVQYSFLVVIWGLVLTAVGWSGIRLYWAGLIYLVFMIPLPYFLQNTLTSELQLVSSVIGARLLQLFGVTVYLEGNIIDLGNYKLQVVEACSGLRYLFPLASLGFLFAYLYRASLWKRVFVVLSTVPITVFMNSFRIAVIGVLVNRYGTDAADGFLHFFEGWVIFMACIAILLFEMWFLGRLGKDRSRELFAVEVPPLDDFRVFGDLRNVGKPLVSALSVVLIAGLLSPIVSGREERIPERASFDQFPLVLGDWVGKTNSLTPEELDELKLSDYMIHVYQRSRNDIPVELYVAYYDSQRTGASAHSPRACIPGSGWRISDFSQIEVADILPDGSALPVNRALIGMEDQKILVYYLFMQRGRLLTNEYLVKWYIFWDSMTQNRTDGAMVRVMTPVGDIANVDEADTRLQAFLRTAEPRLSYFIPQDQALAEVRSAAVSEPLRPQ